MTVDKPFEPASSPAVSDEALGRIKAVVGEGGWSVDPERLAPKLTEWRDRWTGETPLLVLPRTPAEVAAVVSFLVSPDASYITRQVIDVNGGLY